MSHLLRNNKVLLIFPHALHASLCVSRNSNTSVSTTISHINWAFATRDKLGKIFHMRYLIILTIGLCWRGSYSLYFIDENTNVWKGMFPLLGSHKTQPPDSRAHVLNHRIDRRTSHFSLYLLFLYILQCSRKKRKKTQNIWGDFQRYAKCKVAQKNEGKIRLRLELGSRNEENVHLCLAWWFLAANMKMGILSSSQCTVFLS